MTKHLTHGSLVALGLSLLVYVAGIYLYKHRTNLCGEWLGLYIAIGGCCVAVAAGIGLGANSYIKRSLFFAVGSLGTLLLAALMYVIVGSIASACSGV